MTTPFISVTDLGALLDKDVSADPLATIALDAACEAIRTYTGQHLNLVQGDVITLEGTGRTALLLPELPVLAVNSVTADGTLLAEDDHYTVGYAGIIYRRYRSFWEERVVVNYDHGYAVSEPPPAGTERVPSDVRMVALNLAARTYQDKGRLLMARQESIGAYQYSIGTDMAHRMLMDDERGLLDNYRVRRLPVG